MVGTSLGTYSGARFKKTFVGQRKIFEFIFRQIELTRTKNSHRAPSISSRMQNFSPKGHLVLTTRLKTTYYGDKLTFSSPEPLGFISNTKCPIEVVGSKRGVYLDGVVYICDAVHLRCGLHSIVAGSLICSERLFFGCSGFTPLPKNQHLILI